MMNEVYRMHSRFVWPKLLILGSFWIAAGVECTPPSDNLKKSSNFGRSRVRCGLFAQVKPTRSMQPFWTTTTTKEQSLLWKEVVEEAWLGFLSKKGIFQSMLFISGRTRFFFIIKSS